MERALTEAHRKCEENKQKQRFASEHFGAWYNTLMTYTCLLQACALASPKDMTTFTPWPSRCRAAPRSLATAISTRIGCECIFS